MTTSAGPVRLKPCPICGKMAGERLRPFCSARCADVDLNRWLSGGYALPASEHDDDADIDRASSQDAGENAAPGERGLPRRGT
ncbi:MAG: DNA gyrase inhibitor YacG [Proteobacteria bacterium]|nr:DNA gyrase inhibitor YacG [Pseudomonadota bacterium]